jgi:O-antigen/teichoic acid export membrane protein
MNQPPERPSHKRMSTNVNRGLAWIGVASSLVGILDLLALLIILNTWVTPSQYGVATLVIWVFPILDQATDLGLSAAVIQRDDHDDDTISTVFWINLLTATVLFAVILVGAPLVTGDHPIIGYMLIAYGTKLLWQNIYFIPTAMMKRELRFKELSVIRILANIAEFLGKVGFAWAGFGIWCFVLGPLCRVFVTGVGSQIRHPWRPRLVFKFHRAKEYVTFGLKSSGSQILFYFYTNIDYPIVGFFFGEAAVGVYRLAYEIVLEPVRMISNVVVDIAFPAFARLRHAADRLIAQFVSFTKLNLITVMMYSAVVFIAAEDVIATFFPDYEAAVPAVRILCAVAVLRSISFVMPPLLDGVGYPHRTFNYMLVAAVVLPLSFIAGAKLLGGVLTVPIHDVGFVPMADGPFVIPGLGHFGWAVVDTPSGYLSVAVAWAIGYPIAFAVLVMLVMYTLDYSWLTYVRAIAGVVVCILAGAVVAWGAHLVIGQLELGWFGPRLRLAAIAVVMVAVTGWLLAHTQGLSLRTARAAMKGPPDSPAAGDET